MSDFDKFSALAKERLDQDPPAADVPVIIVDDDEQTRYSLGAALASQGYEIILAASGSEALRHILSRDVAVILLDINMPGLNGYETATLIRERKRSRSTPIIFLTAFGADEMRVFEGYAAGAVDYILKPPDLNILRAKVAIFAELFRRAEQLRWRAETERRLRAEQDLLTSSLPVAFYRTPQDCLADGSRLVSGNAMALTGFEPAAFLAPGFWSSRLHEDDREHVLAELAMLPRSGKVEVEYRWRGADETYQIFLDQAVVLNGSTLAGTAVGLWRDVTERRNLEQRLHGAQRLEATSVLAGGMAHDFNNILTIIAGHVEAALDRLGEDEQKVRACLENALEGSRQGAEITRRLLAFARKQPLDTGYFRLNEVVARTLPLLESAMSEQVRIETRLDNEGPAIEGDAAQTEMALVNFVLNARDAMPEGGVVTIATATREIAAQADHLPRCRYAELTVTDTGAGIPADVLNRVFEPFFTTKRAGSGTGLGLSAAYGFARQSGGDLLIDSAVGRGTTVRLLLPAAVT